MLEVIILTKNTAASQKQVMAEQAWLNYFNKVLFEKGLITERERNKMVLKIDQRQPKNGK